MAMGRSELPNMDSSSIALFGGTFDPIHIGHLRSAQEICEAFHLARLIFVPAAVPPHKPAHPVADADHRVQMVRLAINGNPLFELSDIEIRRQGTSYSIETVSHFRRLLEEQVRLFFIMGADAFCEMETWKDYRRLLTLCDFIVITRPESNPLHASVLATEPFREIDPRRRFRHPSGSTLYLHEVTPIGVSSTQVRTAVAEGRSIAYLVPQNVANYIEREGLYAAER